MALVFQEGQALGQGIQQAGTALGQALQQQGAEARQQDRQLGLESRKEDQRLKEREEALTERSRQSTILGGVFQNMQKAKTDVERAGALAQGLDDGLSIEYAKLGSEVFKNLSPKSASNLNLSPFEKESKKRVAKVIFDQIDNVPKLAQSKEGIARLKELSKEVAGGIGIGGYAQAAYGSEAATELNALGLTSIEPILKVLNPRGQLPIRKIEMIKKDHSPNAWDTRWKIDGKIKALERFTDAGIKQSERLQALFLKYGEDIPIEELLSFESEGEQIVDSFINDSRGEPDAKVSEGTKKADKLPSTAPEGTPATDEKTGQKYIFKGKRWVKQ